MREIKFRAWNKTKNKMIIVKDIITVDEKLKVNNDNWDWYKDEYILMQYTGLNDKEGREIYERDIVNVVGVISKEQYEVKKDFIEINTPQLGNILIYAYVLYCRKTDYKQLMAIETTTGLLSGTVKYEVIGNIYENPELLEDKNE